MANVVPFSFKGELMSGTHNFANGGDAFKIALYNGTISATYTTSTTVVQTNDEVSSAGSSNYVRKALGSQAVVATTATTSVDFADVTWSSATFTANYAAIYNDDQGDKLVVVLDFGGAKTATNGDFTISFPDPSTASNAIISLTS
jgi:dihydroxyacetone kinase DhaKLM complex PTS-EIIA-like component DhaM